MIIVLKVDYLQNEMNITLFESDYLVHLLLYLTKLVVHLNLVVLKQKMDIKYRLYLSYTVQRNLIVYLIVVKTRKKKDRLMLMLVYYVKLMELYLLFFMILEKEYVVQLLHLHNLVIYIVNNTFNDN